jgi:hypothetical protein
MNISEMVTPDKQKRRSIGGDFEFNIDDLKKKPGNGIPLCGPKGTWTASGRSAFSIVLKHLRNKGIGEVLLPAYLCESILQPVKALGFKYSFYHVDNSLAAHPEPKSGTVVYLIHYFGWMNPSTGALRERTGKGFHLIEDASQALLSDWGYESKDEQHIVLSPRKYGPLPLGGWCSLIAGHSEPLPEMEMLAWRSLAARLVRRTYLAESDAPVDPEIEEFYMSALRSVEIYLNNHPADAGLPGNVLSLVEGLDWIETGRRRRENWQYLNKRLGGYVEPLMPDLPPDVVPLGYVIRLRERDKVRARLAARRIFCPVHWPLPDEISESLFPVEVNLSNTFMTIPIDQRYGLDDMDYIADVLKESL